MHFQLGARTLAIDADPGVLPEARALLREIGFDPQPWTPAGGPRTRCRAGGPHDHPHGADKADHAHESVAGPGRLAMASGLAAAAELASLLQPARAC